MKHFNYILLTVFAMFISLHAMDNDPNYIDARDDDMEHKLRRLRYAKASPTLAAMAHRGYIPQPPSGPSKKECPIDEKEKKLSSSPVSLGDYFPPHLKLNNDEDELPRHSSKK